MQKVQFRTIKDRVLIRPLEEEEGPIVIEKNPTDLIRGIVLSVGPEAYTFQLEDDTSTPTISVDDIVLFRPQDAVKYPIENEVLYIIHDKDIVLVEEKDENG